ncbi:MAG: dihydrofolate reductase [Candidatus Magasanikbacteria bacterium]|mgnify:CR=1 FL=1|jgi:dihydrofolate reductase|nr:dihydrofolate reductase [Candidatus Magasanikbacteria bacterium]
MISLIVAMSENNCIGKDGGLPWHIKEDMARVKAFTTGKVLIMGRNTWESIPKKFRPLPNRTNIVITRNEAYDVPKGVEVYNSIEAAIEAHKNEEIVSFGGAGIYKAMLPIADKLEVTHVHKHVDGDTFFPDVNWDEWKETARENFEDYSFASYERL